MKQFLLFFFVVASCSLAAAQLKADAGNDAVWCWPRNGFPGFQIGSTSPARGGMPPYSYLWTSYGTSASANDLMDSVTSPHPSLYAINLPPNTDSAYFVLQVTDASGTVADDTVKVYFSHWGPCAGTDLFKVKRPGDTISIITDCKSQFAPLTYSWNPVTYLSDPAVPDPRCWSPVSQDYTVHIWDSKGCRLNNTFRVEIISTSVLSTHLQEEEAVVTPNPVTIESNLKTGASWMGGTVSIFTYDGRLTGSLPITGANTPLQHIIPSASGIYFYRLYSPLGAVSYGKLIRQ